VLINEGSKLSREDQDDLRRQIATMPVVIKDVARAQHRHFLGVVTSNGKNVIIDHCAQKVRAGVLA
jgi:hypothetical protein